MSEPANKKLYEKVKDEIYKKYPKHSAYRSGLLVKSYKEAGGTYKGKKMRTQDYLLGLKKNGLINVVKLDIKMLMMFIDQQ